MELPKNICQIGENDKYNCIYIEDYVITYLHQVSATMELGSKAIALLGKIERQDEKSFYFIYGAICSEKKRLEDGKSLFDPEDEKFIQERKEEYFHSLNVIGWAVIENEFNMISDDGVWKRNTPSEWQNEQKLYLKMNLSQKEEQWKLYQNGIVKTIAGYAIFYDRNEMMQGYLIAWHKEKKNYSIENVSDSAARQFRSIVMEKQDLNYAKRIMSVFYGVCTLLMITLCVIGVTTLNHYDKMIQVENSITQLVQAMNEKKMAEETPDINRLERAVPIEQKADQDNESDNEIESEVESETEGEIAEAVHFQEGEVFDNEVTAPQEQEDMASSQENMDSQKSEADESANIEEAKEESEKSYMEYYVQEGDTLAAISLQYYQTTNMVSAICQLNAIGDPDNIIMGQKILLP